jgi:hypothetical protein
VPLWTQEKRPGADTEAAFAQADLLSELYVYPGGEFPTLAALIDDGTRIFLTAETVETAPLPWFQPMFQLYSDTPFTHDDLAALQAPSSCALNRGARELPLFLVNHWIGTPAEFNADVANDAAVLDGCADARASAIGSRTWWRWTSSTTATSSKSSTA